MKGERGWASHQQDPPICQYLKRAVIRTYHFLPISVESPHVSDKKTIPGGIGMKKGIADNLGIVVKHETIIERTPIDEEANQDEADDGCPMPF